MHPSLLTQRKPSIKLWTYISSWRSLSRPLLFLPFIPRMLCSHTVRFSARAFWCLSSRRSMTCLGEINGCSYGGDNLQDSNYGYIAHLIVEHSGTAPPNLHSLHWKTQTKRRTFWKTSSLLTSDLIRIQAWTQHVKNSPRCDALRLPMATL